MSFVIPEGYAFVIFMNVIISVLLLAVGFVAGSQRSKIYTKKYLEENYPEEFKANKIAKGAYPDTGNGYLSSKLSYDGWLAMNNGQRAHYNFLEGAPIILVCAFAAGLVYTRLTVLLQIAYVIGRVLYTIGYLTSGADKRLVGVLVLDVALIALIVTSIMSTLSLGGGFSGFLSFLAGSNKN